MSGRSGHGAHGIIHIRPPAQRSTGARSPSFEASGRSLQGRLRPGRGVARQLHQLARLPGHAVQAQQQERDEARMAVS